MHMSRVTTGRFLFTQGISSSFRTAMHTSWETVRPSRRWTREQELQRVLSQGLKVSRMGGGGETHQIHLRLHVLRSATESGLPWRTATYSESQYPQRRVRPMAGKLYPLFGGLMRMLPSPVVKPCSPSCPKSCSSKRCDVTLRSSRRNKPGGWPASATRKSGKPWPYCIASRPILGRLPHSQTRSEFRVPYWPSVSGVISRRPPLPTSHAGGFSLARNMLTSTSNSVAQIAAEVGL